jgi:ABC-type uncharacterized transport system substrate-binding protein
MTGFSGSIAWPRAALIALCMLLAHTALAGDAPRPHRIGVLNEAWAANHPTVEGLKAGLRELGFEEGRDVTFDVRFTKGDPNAIPGAAKALIEAGAEVLFTSNEAATLAARAATQTLPIVFTLVGDPIAASIVNQLAHPGANVTGISSLTPDLMPKRLELLKILFPAVKRVWFLHDAVDPTGAAALRKGLEAAQQLRIELWPVAILDAPNVARALESVKEGDALIAPDQDGFDIGAAILEKSISSRVPAVFPSTLWVEHGGLVSYGPDYYAQGRQAARLVAKILRGSKPADLPVEGADRVYLTLNARTATRLGLLLSPKILLRADSVRQ